MDDSGAMTHDWDMGEGPKRQATYEDLKRVPDHLVAQIIDGELIVQPRPAAPHAVVSSVLGVDIGGPFHRGRGGPGGWIILDEPELHVERDILVPDLAGWRRERMPKVPNEVFFTLPPDWVCEVLSPSTAGIDRVKKTRIYAREFVAHVWLLDPRGKTLDVLKLDGESYRVTSYDGEEPVRAEPFDAIELDLNALWADVADTNADPSDDA